MNIAALEPQEVHAELHSREGGLEPQEVETRLEELGPNVLRAATPFSWAKSLGRQFTNFFTILLNASAVICFVAEWIQPGESMNVLGAALLGVSVLNAVFSFVQEYRAEKAMEALRSYLPPSVSVRRGGAERTVLADALVPGDVLLLAEGDKIPADARLIHQRMLLVDNAPLTGESRPVAATSDAVGDVRLADARNVVFAGCHVVRGTGEAVVFATGPRTEFGKIATLSGDTSRTISPLQQETNHMVRVLTIVAMAMGFTFFGYGVFTGRPLIVNLVFMMGIIVANVPEGLLPTFTLSLAMGSLRMAKRNALVKSLNAVEAIGAIHVICTDKTGTLTHNELRITKLVDASGEDADEASRLRTLEAALVASDVHRKDGELRGDPLDVAIARVWLEAGRALDPVAASVQEMFPFDVTLRRAGALARRDDGSRRYAVKGAWESLQALSCGVRSGEGVVPLDDEGRDRIGAQVERLAARGYRVIAVASRDLTEDVPTDRESCESSLVVEGFLCLEDPLRDEVPGAVAKAREAGIDIVLITGDHPETARVVAEHAGIVEPGAETSAVTVTGDVLEDETTEGVATHIDEGVRVFARTTPEQKLIIVRALQSRGKIVAMTGDGVNDAPALKAADVGIAMGKSGTEVARESAQVILLDDNFASIVAGVEEGRTVFANIRKFTNYVLVSNGPEILPYLLFILFPVPLALTVVQILSIDLGTDIIPSIALGAEPSEPETMQRPPRGPEDGLLRFSLLAHSYLFLGLLEAAWSFGLFWLVLHRGGWDFGDPIMSSTDPLYQSATGIALSTILLMQIGNLIGRRYRRKSGLDAGLFRNRLLIIAILIQVVFSWATLYTPVMNRILGTQPVDPWVYGLAWLGVPLIWGMDHLRKRAGILV